MLVNDHIIDYVNSRKSSCVNFTGLYAYIYSLLCNSRSKLQRKCSFVLLIFTQVHFCMICGRFNTSIIYYSRQGDQKWKNPPFIVQQLLDSHFSVFTIRDVNRFWSSRRKLKSSRQIDADGTAPVELALYGQGSGGHSRPPEALG